jgi:outer membrane protein assembly factor BamE
MQKLLKLFIALLFVSSAFLTGCGAKVPIIKPFKMDIQQGNVVTSKMLLQLKPGMTKSQVKFIMGTPLVVDSFHTNRWDYFYQMRQAGKIVEQRRVILEFDKDLLTRVRGDVVPEGTAGAAAGNESGAAKTITVEPKAKEEGLLDKLKFWKSDPKPADAKSAPKEVAPELKAPETQPEINLKNPANNVTGLEHSSAGPEANNDAPAADTPSVLAVPIEIAPVPDAPAVEVNKIEAPVVEAPKVEAPKIEPVKVEPAKTEPPKVAPIKPAEPIKPVAPAPVKTAPVAKPAASQNEPFSFRMDRNLDIKNLETPPVEAAPVAKPKVDPPPPEAEPGYFEKMLEKIGF